MARRIVWGSEASAFLKVALKRIGKESFFQAERIESGIISALMKAAKNPERFPIDKYKQDDNADF